ncbi:clathrin adaptor mu subunit, partial [Schizophyllum amplum]
MFDLISSHPPLVQPPSRESGFSMISVCLYILGVARWSLTEPQAFFIFNQKGEVLISRLYRTDFKRSIADVFRIQVVSNSDVRSPIITLGSTSFFHVRINNLYVVAVTKVNANAALEAIKNNFVLIYELIDEICDLEEGTSIQEERGLRGRHRDRQPQHERERCVATPFPTRHANGRTAGTVLRADVDGHIQMRAYLSGTPECKFGLNDKLVIDKNDRGMIDAVELDDCRFHQCVRLHDFDASRTISFIPPDGEFELMRYRSTTNVKLPLRVIPTVTEIGKTQVQYNVTVKTNFNNKLSATNVVVRIPTPLNTTTVDCQVLNGKAKYTPGENVVVWKIPRLQGGQECTLSATAERTSTTNQQTWARPPIDVDFQVLMFTASGLIVRFLKVFEKSNYSSVKWVRYLTKANGSYQIR